MSRESPPLRGIKTSPGRAGAGQAIASPALRSRGLGASGGVRGELLAAVLRVTGLRGYSEVAVQHVIEQAGVSRNTFYAHFANKEECFEAAYRLAAEALAEEALDGIGPSSDWPRCVAGGLSRVFRFALAEPEVFAAFLLGGTATPVTASKHREVTERLERLVDRGRHQPGARTEPSPLTARLLVGGVEEMLLSLVLEEERRESTGEILAALVYLHVIAYLDEDSAVRAMDEVQAPTVPSAGGLHRGDPPTK